MYSITCKIKLNTQKKLFDIHAPVFYPSALLIGGGLQALQTAVITAGVPFCILMLIMCYNLYPSAVEAEDAYSGFGGEALRLFTGTRTTLSHRLTKGFKG